MKKDNLIVIISTIITIFLLLIVFDRDKVKINREFDSNYNDKDNSIYFYEFKNKIYYVDNNLIDKNTNIYSIDIDPRSYTDFRDFYLLKNSVLISGKYVNKYKCKTNNCYVIKSDDASSLIDMNSKIKTNYVEISDGDIVRFRIVEG